MNTCVRNVVGLLKNWFLALQNESSARSAILWRLESSFQPAGPNSGLQTALARPRLPACLEAAGVQAVAEEAAPHAADPCLFDERCSEILAVHCMLNRIRVATRGSKLALWQAEHIAERLKSQDPDLAVELKIIKTSGDKIQDVPLAQVGGKGLFVKEIEEALLAGEADLAVHSMKDMPAETVSGLTLGVIPERDDHTDSLLSTEYDGLDGLPPGSVVGTSSLRRQAQLLNLRPDLQVEPLRGNLDTRLRKLEQGLFAAIIVATVGLKRLGLSARYQTALCSPEFLPAIGQGALGIEYRQGDRTMEERLQFLNDAVTQATVTAERAFLHELEGGCQVPIGGLARMDGPKSLVLEGLVAEVDGKRLIRRSGQGKVEDAEGIGRRVARNILDNGGKAILDQVYGRH